MSAKREFILVIKCLECVQIPTVLISANARTDFVVMAQIAQVSTSRIHLRYKYGKNETTRASDLSRVNLDNQQHSRAKLLVVFKSDKACSIGAVGRPHIMHITIRCFGWLETQRVQAHFPVTFISTFNLSLLIFDSYFFCNNLI